MRSPAMSRMSSHARGPRPLSMACVSPTWRPRPRSKARRSEAGNELLQLRPRALLHVAVERVAVRVDPDGERAEVLDAELPQALGHQLLPDDLLDLLDLGRLERRRPADDGEIDHAESTHRLDGLVGEAALAADRAHAVLLSERLGEAHHARARRRADADLLVPASAFKIGADLPYVGRGVQQEGAGKIHRRLDALVEDADLGPVADADDVALHGDLVSGAELQDLLRVADRERELVRRH